MNVVLNAQNSQFIDYIKKQALVKRFIEFLIGCFIIAMSYNLFVVPNKLVPGGVGGIAVITNKVFGFENAVVILCINIFLLAISFLLLGKKKTSASILGSLIFPFLIKLTENINVWIGMDTSHLLMSTILGGLLYGFGAGLVFRAGFTTGGTDIVNQILSKYLKQSLGSSMLVSDGLIVLSSVYFFGLNSVMYSVLFLYIISMISDRVVLGISDSKVFFIVTEKENEVREYILKSLGHGVTIFNAKGGYKKENSTVLMTVLPTKDYYLLKEGIRRIDSDAFYIITDTYEVFGGE